ncbi:MAG: peptidoglycan DD-metalloendopeptidase family protein [Candidatus Gracilibacteria bacterium]|nr:peptidoglycan DD-metalloendopeptidase family protein [Candidatus Gracilibacteria bacterium]
MNMKMTYRFLFGLLLLLFFLVPSVSFAEELELEIDPDEYLIEEDSSTLGRTSSRQDPTWSQQLEVSPDKEGDIPVRDLFEEGYRKLFRQTSEEVSGLEAVLVPLQQDVSLIDAQIQQIQLQQQRLADQQEFFKGKLSQLMTLQSRFLVQEKLLELEKKDLQRMVDKLVQIYFRVKREYIMENGQLNLYQWLSSRAEPGELVFQDYLLRQVYDQLVDQFQQLLSQEEQLVLLKMRLQVLQDQLVINTDQIGAVLASAEQQKVYQRQLLAEKKHEQVFFSDQLEEARLEQEALYERITSLAAGLDTFEYQDFPREQMIWPVSPSLGVSAGFQDEGYRNRFGLEHNAIDIPTDQLTPIQAPLAGRVIKVHDGGKGYSYLQLAHRDGLSTVYGHVYSFMVNEGDFIKQGQVMALSGGAIGTNGAGRLTTGPHLHFEVLKDGRHVDPRDYLEKE